MKILVACEESQEVTKAFRAKGHEAYSCDTEPCSGGHPEWHIRGDVRPQLTKGWDIIVAFPPCTHLAVSGARYFAEKRADGRQQAAIDLFMELASAPAEKIAIENPVGIMSTVWRKPDQIIQPYEYGHPESKKTCLWLKGLPKLKPTKILQPPPAWMPCPDCDNFICTIHKQHAHDCECPAIEEWAVDPYETGGRWENQTPSGQNKLGPSSERAKIRSKTYEGIAVAMAEQWG